MLKDSLVRKVSLFTDLPDSDLKLIANITLRRSFRKHEVIFHANDSGTALFILQSGMVKISIMDQNAREVILKLLYHGDFFGEMALLDGKHRSATVTAIDKVEALVIEREAFLRLLRSRSDLLMNMLLAVSRRLRQTDEKIRSLVFADVYGKFARTILGLVHENGEQGDDGLYVDTPLSRQELAQLMGVTRQTLSKLLREYQQSGVLKITRQRIHILDEARLQKEAL